MKLIDKLKREVTYIIKRVTVKKNPDKIKWGIIGLGHMANVFTKAINISEFGEVIAVASRSKDKSKSFAKKHHIKQYYDSYESMLSDTNLDIDIVYIATPVKCHYENILLALQNGRNVLCEKPLVTNSSKAKEIFSLAQEKGLFVMEGLWSLCLPTYQIAKNWINSSEIGEIKYIRADLSKHEIYRDDDIRFGTDFSSGVLFDYGIYPLSFTLYYLGYNFRINDITCIKHKNGYDVEWKITLNKNNVTAEISLSSCFDGSKKALILGENGSIEWDTPFNRTNKVTLYDIEGKKRSQFIAKYISEGFEYEIMEIYNILRGYSSEPIIKPEFSYQVSKLFDKLLEYKSLNV